MTDLIQVFITASSREEGQRIVEALVKSRLIACGQVVGPVQSTYWWQGSIESSAEWLCLAKSREDKFTGIVRRVKDMHSYQVPEIIAMPLAAVSDDYAQWLREEIKEIP